MTMKLVLCLLLICVLKSHAYENCLAIKSKTIKPEDALFCCNNEINESLRNVFHSVNFKLRSFEEFTVTVGTEENHNEKQSASWLQLLSWFFNFFKPWNYNARKFEDTRKLSPYQKQLICITPNGNEPVRMNVALELELSFILFFIIGVILFFSARHLSSSMTFYYSGSIGFGVLCSMLLVVFILSRYVPKKPVAYTILAGGWGLCAWVFNVIWSNIETILITYKLYVFMYVILMGFISFAICYWYGPVENSRTQNLVQWLLQLVAVGFLYNSSQKTEVSMFFITSVFAAYIFNNNSLPVLHFVPIQKLLFKLKWYRAEKRFLTEEEYRQQGIEETRKALEDLRNFCNSPQCSPWKTMTKLKNPNKFASFIEGDSHVDDAEQTLYENEAEQEDDDDSNISSDEDSILPEEINSTDNEVKEERKIFMKPDISEDEDSLLDNDQENEH